MIECRGRIVLGKVASPPSAPHGAGGVVMRFAIVITPRHVHYTFGNVNRHGGRITRSIARHHRDLHP